MSHSFLALQYSLSLNYQEDRVISEAIFSTFKDKWL